MKESDLTPPEGWGEDLLSSVFVSRRRNAFSTFAGGAERFESLGGILEALMRAGAIRADDSGEALETILIGRAASAFIGAAEMASSGQVTEAYTLCRSLIEWATYSCLLLTDRDKLKLWLVDAVTELASQQSQGGAITWKAARESIPDPRWSEQAQRLYKWAIDAGAHPKVASARNNLRVEPLAGTSDHVMTVVILSRDAEIVEAAAKFVAECGIVSLWLLSASCDKAFTQAKVSAKTIARLESQVAKAKPISYPNDAPARGTDILDGLWSNIASSEDAED